jgi:hypothetical protein
MNPLHEMQDFLADPAKVQEMIEHFKKKESVRRVNMDRMRKFFDSDESFGELVRRIISKHDTRWTDACYKNGIMPHPWNILYSVHDIVEAEGEEVKPLDGLTRNFPSVLIEYRGWTFAITHGQGSVLSVYEGETLVYRD